MGPVEEAPAGRQVLDERALQKVRKQEQGHEYVERLLVAHGATPLRAYQQPAAWLKQALAEIGARTIRHRGNHRYVFRLGRTRRERDGIDLAYRSSPFPKLADAA